MCVQAGTIVAELNELSDIVTPRMMGQLMLLGSVVLGLSYVKRRTQRKSNGGGGDCSFSEAAAADGKKVK